MRTRGYGTVLGVIGWVVLLWAAGCGDGGGGGGHTHLFVRDPANPVYVPSGSAWNFAGIGDPSVIYDPDDSLFKMWLSGGGVVGANPDAIVRTQYLTSPDGVVWTEYGTNPVFMEGLGPTDWDRGGVETVTVLKLGTEFWMWYGGYEVRAFPPVTMKIGLATSLNGVDWSRYGSNPLLAPGPAGAWDELWIESPVVAAGPGGLYMLYTGVDSGLVYRIGLATSPDGIVWTKYAGNPVLSPNPACAWENGAVYGPALLFDGTQFRMWYVGLNAVTFLDAMRIGMATSPDGTTWTRSPSNPVLDVGNAGQWDAQGAFVPSVILKDGTCMMWYASGANPDEKVGLARWTP